jgi:ABC-type polysaccharide/polyol phosphate export permease
MALMPPYSLLQTRGLQLSPSLLKASTDLRDGLLNWELWGTLAWHDIRQRYRRSMIGPFWLTLSMGITVGTVGLLYSAIFGQPVREYLPFFAIGVIVWGFLSSSIIEGSQVFIISESVIKQIRTPLSAHMFRMVWRNVVVLAHNMVIYAIVVVVFGIRPGANAFIAIPGLVLLFVAGFWCGLLIGLLSARFRDLPPIVTNAVQVCSC